MSAYEMPTLDGVGRARERIAGYLSPTPLRHYPSLSEVVGTDVWVKHENMLPTGAFKVRGGVNLMVAEQDEVQSRGVIGASTGNHGQSVAYAARLFDIPAVICVPENANPVKVRSMRDLGADVILSGADFDEAREHCQQLAQERGLRYVHSGNEPLLIEGVGTYALELVEELPDLDVVIVPIGGGSGAAGVCIVLKTLQPNAKVIGVQAAAAPAAYRSWKARAMVEDQMRTRAEGLATRTAFELPQQILWELLDDFVLVSEEDLERSTVAMIEHTRTLAEAAGAAALAAASNLGDVLADQKVALICSGANITPDQLRAVLTAGGPK